MSILLTRRISEKYRSVSSHSSRSAKNFRTQQDGTVALLFGLLILPLLFAAGAAVDYGRRSGAKAQLDAALDAALIGVSARKTNSVTADMLASAQTQFRSDAAKMPGVTITSFLPTAATTGAQVTLGATYTATVSTSLGSLMNIKNMDISGRSETVRKVQQYIDFYLLLDNSPSMGVAATAAEIAKLKSLTPDQCAFACHLLKSDGSENTNDYYNIAKRNNVKLRINNLRDAVSNLVDSARTNMGLADQFRMEMWTFSDIQTRLIQRTTDLAQVKAAAGRIDMAYSYADQRDNQTAYERAINTMNSTVPASGSGLTAADPVRFLFFVTDGVQDTPIDGMMTNEASGYRINGNRFISPINPATCQAMKDKNIKIGIIYTQYLPLTGNGFYDTYVGPFENRIGSLLKSCATDGLYFPVSTDGDINTAMQQLFAASIASVRITN